MGNITYVIHPYDWTLGIPLLLNIHSSEIIGSPHMTILGHSPQIFVLQYKLWLWSWLWDNRTAKKIVVLKPRKFSIFTMESICSKNVCFWIALAPNRHFLMSVFIMQSAVHCRSNSHEIYLTIIWMILSIRSFFKKVNQTSWTWYRGSL